MNKAMPGKRTKIGITSLVFLLYVVSVYVFSFKEEYNTISVAVFVIFSMFALAHVIHRNQLKFHRYHAILIAFVLYSFASSFWAIDFSTAVTKSVTLLLMFILSLTMYQVFSEENGIDFILKSLLAAGMVMSLYAVFYYGPSGFMRSILTGARLGTEINQANIMGVYAGNTVILCVYYALKSKRKIMFALSVLPFLVCLSSGSRKGLAIFLLGSFLLVFFYKGSQKIYKGIFAALLIGVLLFYLLQLPVFYNATSRMRLLLNVFNGAGSIDTSAKMRFFMIEYGISQFKNNPIWGYGADNAQYLSASVLSGRTTYLHNNYIEMLVNYGLVGFFLYYSLFVNIVRKLLVRLKDMSPEVIVITVLFLIHLISDYGAVSYYDKITYILLTAGIIAINISKEQAKVAPDDMESGRPIHED